MGYIILLFLIGVILGASLEWELTQAWLKYKKQNKVHFYIAKDKRDHLILWFGKPKRYEDIWVSENGSYTTSIAYGEDIKELGLNYHDYDNLKWEDEPLEVFITLKE